MRRFCKLGMCLLWLVTATGFAQETPPEQVPGTNFTIYTVDRIAVDQQVELQGIFDPKPVKERVRNLSQYATAAKIDDEPADDEQARLDHYQIMQDPEDTNVDIVRTIQLRNRFGEQTVWLGTGVSFLSAAGEGGAEPVAGLDSYKGYIVLRGCGTSSEPLKLTDEFGEAEKVLVRAPVMLAVPVSVNGEPIKNANLYLAIYDITPEAIEKEVQVKNRFGNYTLKTKQRVLLAVPTEVTDIFPPAQRHQAQARPDTVRRNTPSEAPISWLRPAALWFRELFSRQVVPGSEQP